MVIHKTLQDARAAASTASPHDAVCVIEIEHAVEGRVFVNCRCRSKQLEAAMVQKAETLRDIVRVIAEHSLKTPEQEAALREECLRTEIHCERCGCHVDGNTCYHQQEWARFGGRKVRVEAYYCDRCAALLRTIGAGEYTAMQERADDVPSYEPETKSDF